MKKLFTSVFFLLCLYHLLPAQNFVPLGATWHYANNMFYPFWEKMVYEKDTLVAGENCMKMQLEVQNFGQAGPGAPFVPEARTYTHRLFFLQGDTLFERTANSAYHVLFVFNASVGDRWETAAPMYYDSACTVYNYTEVRDTGTVNINGHQLRYWDVGPADSSFMAMEGRFVEKIGYLNGGFHSQFYGPSPAICVNIIVDAAYYSFSCFESDSIGFYNIPQWPYSECEFNFSVDALQDPDIRIFPNPATDHVQVEMATPGMYTVRVLDLQGRTLALPASVENKGRIPFGIYKPGVYLLEISAPGGMRSLYKVLKSE